MKGLAFGADSTGRPMRAHFAICPKRPAASDHVDRRGGISQRLALQAPGETVSGYWPEVELPALSRPWTHPMDTACLLRLAIH
jgi:hypothetical protein